MRFLEIETYNGEQKLRATVDLGLVSLISEAFLSGISHVCLHVHGETILTRSYTYDEMVTQWQMYLDFGMNGTAIV